jgi:hypothetical protein
MRLPTNRPHLHRWIKVGNLERPTNLMTRIFSAGTERFVGIDMAVSPSVDALSYYSTAREKGWAGQLAPDFQKSLQRHFSQFKASECEFYHTIRAPDGTIYPGAWDLSGHEKEYLGGIDLAGKRVLEFGPASGLLTAHMSKNGASVVAFDLPPGRGPELVPFPAIDVEAANRSGVESMSRLRNSWWFARKTLGFSADIVYGDIYALPNDIGRFDVAVFGAILLHLSNPFLALRGAAAVITDTIVVTDLLNAPRSPGGDALMIFNPTLPPQGLVTWWGLSPEAIQRMLLLLGFSEFAVTTHEQYMNNQKATAFTVVGRRAGRAGDLPARGDPSKSSLSVSRPEPGRR